ncbi:MAG: Crp/Fnr family transcriptional regulator [Myxococcota bacterium]|nr:Crp/Fnr family transcriptional regulator [Myxococcota bacterium]
MGKQPKQGQGDEAELRRAFERQLVAGEVLFETGDASDSFFVVRRGEVVVAQPDGGARRASDVGRLVARLGPGDPVGEADALAGRPRTARALAASDAVVVEVDRASFEEMFLACPQITVCIVERLAARVADLERRLGVLGMDDLVRPLVRSLLREAEPASEGARALTSLRALAAGSGLTLREAHSGLQVLFDRKLIRLVDDALLLPDPEALSGCLSGAEDARRAAAARR